jgi:UDP-N-acetyl-D-mannosaminuronate dehydrogenase
MQITNDLEKAIEGSDCLIVVTRHREYQSLKPSALKAKMRTPVIVDGRNVFNQDECLSRGFSFRGVGLPTKKTN